MPPRHLGWLLADMQPPQPKGLTDDQRATARALLAEARAEIARRGETAGAT